MEAYWELQRDLETHPRRCGYYLKGWRELAPLRAAGMNDEQIADEVFEAFDEVPWPAREQRPTDSSWEDYAVGREEARALAVAALIAGPECGHNRLTMTPEAASAFFDRFDALFTGPRKYFARLGLGNQDYAFQHGIAILSQDHGGLLWIVEGD